jgi:hypothetical protein
MTYTLKPECEHRTISLTKDNIQQTFSLNEYKRKVHESQVAKVLRGLLNGEHFDTSLSVIDGKEGQPYVVVDGQHRVLAMQKFFQINREVDEIIVPLEVYPDNADVRAKYSKINQGIPEKIEDYLNAYKDEIPIYGWIKNGFPVPVTVYKSDKSVPLKLLLGSYLGAVNGKERSRIEAYSFSFPKKEEALKLLKELDVGEYENMFRFAGLYSATFGVPTKGNPYYRRGVFIALSRIYYDNANRFNYGILKKDFEKLKGDWQITNTEGGGKEAVEKAYVRAIDILNRNREKRRYVEVRTKTEKDKPTQAG